MANQLLRTVLIGEINDKMNNATQNIEDGVKRGSEKARIIKAMSQATNRDVSTIVAILSGKISEPPESVLKGMSKVLDVPVEKLKNARNDSPKRSGHDAK